MRLASITAVVVGSLALAAAPASANVSHVFSTSFGAEGSTPANPHPLSGPTDVAVDQSSRDFYVTDPGNNRVEKFDSSGNFLRMFGKNVNSGTGNPNVCTNAGAPTDICQPGSSGSSPGQFVTPTFLAVDNSGGPSNGDVYVGDTGTNFVQKFDSSGHIVSGWGVVGQKDGSDATNLPIYGPVYGVAVDANGVLYVSGGHYNPFDGNLWLYTQDGTYLRYNNPAGIGPGGIKAYLGIIFATDNGGDVLTLESVTGGSVFHQFTHTPPTSGFDFDPSQGDLYQGTGSLVNRYSAECVLGLASCQKPLDSFGAGHLSGGTGVAVDGTSHTVYVADSTANDVAAFRDVRPQVTTGGPTNVTESSVTLTGHIDPLGRGDISSCHFEYGFDTSYGASVPCTPDPASSNFSGPTDVTATLSGLSPGTRDHYRLVAGNVNESSSNGGDQTFVTTAPPAIDGLAADNLTATSADINAQVNPNGLDTTYHVEYGTTTSYGQVAPASEGSIGASNSDQSVSIHLDNLTPRVVYHYRLLTTNADGTTASVDHTFNFFPPSCPNENVRQQAQANYLPDCRAYELVSPGDAANTQLYPGGPNTGHATNPSRFSFTGQWGAIPNSGGSPIDGAGDLYVATRTDTGWVSRYVGLPSSQAAVDGGPPQGLPGSVTKSGNGKDQEAGLAFGTQFPDKIQSGVLTDLGMDTFLSFNDGSQSVGSINTLEFHNPNTQSSNAPYVFAADGSLRDRWPTNLGAVPDGAYPSGSNLYSNAIVALSHNAPPPGAQPLHTASGGAKALDCPAVYDSNIGGGGLSTNDCPGDVTASADLNHFVFATEWNVFAPGGRLAAPGSVYDNDTVAGTVVVASKTPAGDDIPSEPADQAGDPLQIPAVSTDGSHILIAAGGTGPCGFSNCPTPPCGSNGGILIRCAMQPSHLYMRVDHAITYDVSAGHDVNYVGATADLSKVYFTTDQQLTPDDTDTSTDLYMWSEATDSLTLVSKGDNGAGNSDACNAAFPTAKCGVVTYSNISYCQVPSGLGGNCHSDNSIASQSGDIYFFSPEQLVGTRGIANRENLYDYRGGALHYVTTLTTGSTCVQAGTADPACSDTPIARMQVSPDGAHMAFLTASPVTQYDNAGRLEMYTYDPATGNVTCASCIPSGAPPTSDVRASENGLFMTDDGRTFFSTDDALVHADTNQAQDIYEYVDGHPQLITPGTGDTRQAGLSQYAQFNLPGLIGVSANGTDAYFSTNQTLVPQDQNGLFIKFYDARSGGGFPAPPPPPGCTAADECHGAGSSAPAALQNGTGASLGAGGNVSSQAPPARHHKRHKRSHHRHRTQAHANRGGNK